MKKLIILSIIAILLTGCGAEMAPGESNSSHKEKITVDETTTEKNNEVSIIKIYNGNWKDYFNDEIKEKINPVFDKKGKLESITCSYYLKVKDKYAKKIDILQPESTFDIKINFINMKSYISQDGNSYKIDGINKEYNEATKICKNISITQNDSDEKILHLATTNMALHQKENGKNVNIFAHYKNVKIKDINGKIIIEK